VRKNILIFGHSYATQFVDINNQYTNLFDKDKFEVTVAYLTGEPNEDIKNKHTAEHIVFLNSPAKSTRGLKIAAIKNMLKLCKEKKFTIGICHRYKPSYIMLWVSLFYKIPALFCVMHELGTLASLSRKLSVAMLSRNNIIFAGVSDAVRDNIRRDIWGVPPKRVITLHNMIDVEATESQLLDSDIARDQLNLAPNDFVFGTVGRLAKNKDQKTLIQAFASIKSQCPQAKLVIAGDGQLENELKTQAQELGLAQDVIFTGFLADAFRYMKAFNVFVLPSIQEAFGRVLLEAMIAKTPIIAARVNGIPEVIGDAGTVIPAANPEKLAEEMLAIYKLSPAERNTQGMGCYERAVKHFSLQRFNEIFWQHELVQIK
jgi:glycosyltransferase involved in cell wall biosynthesis